MGSPAENGERRKGRGVRREVASGVVEYIDPLEEETVMLAMSPADLDSQVSAVVF